MRSTTVSPCSDGIVEIAEIHILAAHRHLDPPILRHPALRDVETRHDLDA